MYLPISSATRTRTVIGLSGPCKPFTLFLNLAATPQRFAASISGRAESRKSSRLIAVPVEPPEEATEYSPG
jgi:hypothetical protein